MKHPHAALIAMFLLLLTTTSWSSDTVDNELETLVRQALKAEASRDCGSLLKVHHPDSSTYESILEMGEAWKAWKGNPDALQPPQFDLTLKSFATIGTDGDLTVARVKEANQLVRQPRPPSPQFPYELRVSDVLYVFRKHDGAWRIWATKVLSTEYTPVQEVGGDSQEDEQVGKGP